MFLIHFFYPSFYFRQISTVNTVSTDTIPRPPLATSNQNVSDLK